MPLVRVLWPSVSAGIPMPVIVAAATGVLLLVAGATVALFARRVLPGVPPVAPRAFGVILVLEGVAVAAAAGLLRSFPAAAYAALVAAR